MTLEERVAQLEKKVAALEKQGQPEEKFIPSDSDGIRGFGQSSSTPPETTNPE